MLEHQGSHTLRSVHRSLRSALDRIAHAAPGQQHAAPGQPVSGNGMKSAAALQSDSGASPQPGSRLQRQLSDAPDLASDADDESMSERQAFTAALQSMPSRLDSGERDQVRDLICCACSSRPVTIPGRMCPAPSNPSFVPAMQHIHCCTLCLHCPKIPTSPLIGSCCSGVGLQSTQDVFPFYMHL